MYVVLYSTILRSCICHCICVQPVAYSIGHMWPIIWPRWVRPIADRHCILRRQTEDWRITHLSAISSNLLCCILLIARCCCYTLTIPLKIGSEVEEFYVTWVKLLHRKPDLSRYESWSSWIGFGLLCRSISIQSEYVY